MNILRLFGLTLIALTALIFFTLPGTGAESRKTAAASQYLVFIGTYTGAKSKGIYAAKLDSVTGKLTPPELVAETQNPTFLAIHPNNGFLYAANEIGNFAGKKNQGAVSAFAIAPETGKLKLLNQVSSGGAGPCHLTVDRTGQAVLVANYVGGSVAALPVKPDGQLGEATAFIQHTGSSVNRQRQAGPHGHCILPDAADRFVFACDLGLDKVLIYDFDPAKGSLVAHDPAFATLKAGAGPRHLAFHPNGRWVYVINELDSTVTAFAYDARQGALKEFQSLSTLPADFKGNNSTAEVEVHPSGKFLYGSNRGHDSIVVYAIDGNTGQLTLVEHQSTQGKTPRSFGIVPTGEWLLAANQATDNIVVFRVDPTNGRLSPTGQIVEVGAPVCVKFVPTK